jgi:hypothetical protein
MGAKLYITAALIGGAAAVAAHFPASWAAKATYVDTPAQFGGSLWNGHVRGLGALPPIRFSLSPAALITRKGGITFDGSGGGVTIRGAGSPASVSDLSIAGDAAFLSQIDSRLSGLSGRFSVNVVGLKTDGTCSEATRGQLRTNILSQNGGALGWTGPDLSGPITCEGGDLSAIMSGESPGQTIEAKIKVLMDGSFQLRFVVNSSDPRAGLVLPLYGFETRGERYTLTEAGSWR